MACEEASDESISQHLWCGRRKMDWSVTLFSSRGKRAAMNTSSALWRVLRYRGGGERAPERERNKSDDAFVFSERVAVWCYSAVQETCSVRAAGPEPVLRANYVFGWKCVCECLCFLRFPNITLPLTPRNRPRALLSMDLDSLEVHVVDTIDEDDDFITDDVSVFCIHINYMAEGLFIKRL